MQTHDADVAVLGAGPAGAIAARELGRMGLSVALIDPGRPVAGHAIESFPASGAPLAEAIGLLEPICAASHGPAATMRMIWRDRPETRDFGPEGPLLIDRAALHRCLMAQACAAPAVRHVAERARRLTNGPDGADVATDGGSVRVRLVIDARGRARATAQGLSGDLTALPFSGMLTPPTNPEMHLEALPNAWIWACRLETGAVHGAAFQRALALAGRSASMRAAHGARALAASPGLSTLQRVRFGQPGSAGFAAIEDPAPFPRHLVIGDAALARDPIASHGLVHALRSAVQGAVAAATILAPDGDGHAAREFLRLKHRHAVRTAQIATQRAYADQTRHAAAFWRRTDGAPPHAATPAPAPTGPLSLARPLTRAPVLTGTRIAWAPAVALPRDEGFAITLGPVTALEIATACRPAAPLAELAARLGRRHPAAAVMRALDQLVEGGALVQAAPPA